MTKYIPTPQTIFFVNFLQKYVPVCIDNILHETHVRGFRKNTRQLLNNQISILLNQPCNINFDDIHSLKLLFNSGSFISKINSCFMEQILENLIELCCENAEKRDFIQFIHEHFKSIGNHIDIITSQNFVFVKRLIFITKYIIDSPKQQRYQNLLNISPFIISKLYVYINDVKFPESLLNIISDITIMSDISQVDELTINNSVFLLPDPLQINYHRPPIISKTDTPSTKYISQLFQRIIKLSRETFYRIVLSEYLTLDDAAVLSHLLSGGDFIRGTFCLALSTYASNPSYSREVSVFFQRLSTKTGVELLRQMFDCNSSASFMVLFKSCGNIFSQILSRYSKQLNPWIVRSAKAFSSSNQWIDILKTSISGDNLPQKLHGIFCVLFRINEMKETDLMFCILQNYETCFERINDLKKLIIDKHLLQDVILSDLLTSILIQVIMILGNVTKNSDVLMRAGDQIYDFILLTLFYTRLVPNKTENLSELSYLLDSYIKCQTHWLSSFIEKEDRDIYFIEVARIAVFIRSLDIDCWSRIFKYCIISDSRNILQIAYNLLVSRNNDISYIERALSLFFDFSVEGTLSRRSQNIRNIAKLFAVLTAASVLPEKLEMISQNKFIAVIIYSISLTFDTYVAENNDLVPLLSSIAAFLETLISHNNFDVVLGIPFSALLSIIPRAHPLIIHAILRLEALYRKISHSQHTISIEFKEPASSSFVETFLSKDGQGNVEDFGRKILNFLLDIIFGGKIYFATVIPL